MFHLAYTTEKAISGIFVFCNHSRSQFNQSRKPVSCKEKNEKGNFKMHSIFGRTEVFAVARTLRYRSWRCVNASRSQSTLEEKPTSVSEAKKKSDIVQVHAKEGEGFARKLLSLLVHWKIALRANRSCRGWPICTWFSILTTVGCNC